MSQQNCYLVHKNITAFLTISSPILTHLVVFCYQNDLINLLFMYYFCSIKYLSRFIKRFDVRYPVVTGLPLIALL